MRRTRLEDSYNLQRLLADYKEHILFITEMKTMIETDEVAKDVAGAEMLIERHQEHKVIKDTIIGNLVMVLKILHFLHLH